MTNAYAAFATDRKLLDSGVWFDFFSPEKELAARIKCRPADTDLNMAFQLASAEIILEQADEPLDNITRMARIYARSVVLEWEINGSDGKPIKCNAANVEKTLIELPVLFVVLRSRCMDWRNWRLKFLDGAVKN